MTGGVEAPVPLQRWVSITASSLNIRNGPSSSEPKADGVSSLRYGSVLRIYEESSGWLKISSSLSHWVYGRYTHNVSPVTVNTDGSNLRTGPGTKNQVAGIHDIGDILYIHETNGSWARVGEFHWIHHSLINPA